MKSNAKAIYSNLGGGAHGHLGLVLTEVQYTLIYPTSFFTWLTRVLSSFRTAQLTMRTPIRGSRTPMKCACSLRWREWNKISSNTLLARLRQLIWRISASGLKTPQQHRDGRTHASARKRRSVDSVRAPWTGGHMVLWLASTATEDHCRMPVA